MSVLHDADPVGPRYVIPAILALLVVAIFVAVAMSLAGDSAPRPVAGDPGKPGLPPYWTVHEGESYTEIARRTGLTIDQLETFNPYTNPYTITPGQKLKLRMNVPLAKPKPKGPMFRTVRTGESFGSIAAKTHHGITNLQRLNPKLKPTQLQPGDRMRLRR